MDYHAEDCVFCEVRSICDLATGNVSVYRRKSHFDLEVDTVGGNALEGHHRCVGGIRTSSRCLGDYVGMSVDAVEDCGKEVGTNHAAE